MSTAIYAGSFDPIHNGHLDIIRRASKIFDDVIVLVAVNPEKKYTFSEQERVCMINDCQDCYDEFIWATTNGTLVDFAIDEDKPVIVKGLRGGIDCYYEKQQEFVNKDIAKSKGHNLETVYLFADEKNAMISSTLVKECAKAGIDISKYVPECVVDTIKEKFKGENDG